MRLHQPVGIWLLFWPCAWALALASDRLEIEKLLLFFTGAVLMRGAGCIVNDIADRNFDGKVERTRNRPLASGELNITQALLLLAVLLLASLLVAYQLGAMVIMWGALALIPVCIYPFMKRVSWWPQLFLGLVFNWGALMGWASVRNQIDLPAILLYIGGVFMTLGYDTIYAHQDKADDARIGVRSTALRLAGKTKAFVSVMYAMAVLCFMLASGNFSAVFLLIPAAIHCFFQVYRLDIDHADSAKTVFFSNVRLGGMIFLCLFFSKL